jgi:hypothetical protein
MKRTFHVRFHKVGVEGTQLKAVQAEDINTAKKQFWDGSTIISHIKEVKPDTKKVAE